MSERGVRRSQEVLRCSREGPSSLVCICFLSSGCSFALEAETLPVSLMGMEVQPERPGGLAIIRRVALSQGCVRRCGRKTRGEVNTEKGHPSLSWMAQLHEPAWQLSQPWYPTLMQACLAEQPHPQDCA